MNYIEKMREWSERRTQEMYDEAKRDKEIQRDREAQDIRRRINAFGLDRELSIAQNWDEVGKYHG